MYRVMDDQFAQQAHRDYVENQVFSAHPAERVYMLYQVAIDSVNTAIARLKDGDIFARGRAVNKAHEAVDELILALDHSVGANFTHTLAELYGYVQRQLSDGPLPKVRGSVSRGSLRTYDACRCLEGSGDHGPAEVAYLTVSYSQQSTWNSDEEPCRSAGGL